MWFVIFGASIILITLLITSIQTITWLGFIAMLPQIAWITTNKLYLYLAGTFCVGCHSQNMWIALGLTILIGTILIIVYGM